MPLPQVSAWQFYCEQDRAHFFQHGHRPGHKQNYATVEGDGGAVGLTQNPAALQRWMVSGPEMAFLINEFQESIDKPEMKTDDRHHEQCESTQKAFFNQVKALSNVIDEMGNPFTDESNDLLVLDTRDIVDSSVVSVMCHLKKLGQEQYDKFATDRLVTQVTPVNDPIKRIKFHLFSRPPVKEKSRTKYQLSSLKSDVHFISCQTRDGDLDDFFSYENQACPPSLSSMGKLKLRKKSDM